MKKELIASLILLVTTVLYLSLLVVQNSALFSARFDAAKAKNLYEQSQWQQSQNFSEEAELQKWALSKGYTGWNNYVDENKDKTDISKTKEKVVADLRKKGISDAQLYAYAGYEYYHGKDPTLLNPEHPPLGKYLIGTSIALTGNEHVVLLAAGIAVLALLFWLVWLASSSLAAASLAVFLTATHTLFIDQLIHGPQLDIFQLLFLLPLFISLYFWAKKNALPALAAAGVFFGLLLAVKTFFTSFLIFGAWLLAFFLFQKKSLRSSAWGFATVCTTGLAVFTLTYLRFFQLGGTPRSFLGVQKYIVMFYRQSGINPVPFLGNYLRLIFTGSWKFWSPGNPVTPYDQWTILWTFTFLAGLFVTYRFIRRTPLKSKPLLSGLLIFSLVYNASLFFIPIFPRYLLLLFVPYHAMIAVYFLSKKQQ